MSSGQRGARQALIILLAFTLQASFGSSVEIHGARPDLGLAAMLLCSIYSDASSGAWLGFAIGLLEGSFAARYVGSMIISRTIAGFGVGLLEERVFRDNLPVALLVVSAGTACAEGLLFVFAPQPHVTRWAIRTILEALYNSILALALYPAIRRLLRRDDSL